MLLSSLCTEPVVPSDVLSMKKDGSDQLRNGEGLAVAV